MAEKLSRQQKRRVCQVAGKTLVSEYARTETRRERQHDRKELAQRMFKRAAAEDYEPPVIIQPETSLVIPDTKIVLPDFRMVTE